MKLKAIFSASAVMALLFGTSACEKQQVAPAAPAAAPAAADAKAVAKLTNLALWQSSTPRPGELGLRRMIISYSLSANATAPFTIRITDPTGYIKTLRRFTANKGNNIEEYYCEIFGNYAVTVTVGGASMTKRLYMCPTGPFGCGQ